VAASVVTTGQPRGHRLGHLEAEALVAGRVGEAHRGAVQDLERAVTHVAGRHHTRAVQVGHRPPPLRSGQDQPEAGGGAGGRGVGGEQVEHALAGLDGRGEEDERWAHPEAGELRRHLVGARRRSHGHAVVGHVDALRLEALPQQVLPAPRRRHDHGRRLGPGQVEPPPVEGHPPPGEVLRLAEEDEVVDGDHQGPATGRWDGEAGGVDDVAGDGHGRSSQPVPELVAEPAGGAAEVGPPPDQAVGPWSGGEGDGRHADAGQGVHQRPHVPPDAAGHGLEELPRVQRDRPGGHRRSP
jgi:hypothetical protein